MKRIDDKEMLEGIAIFETRLILPGSAICLPGVGIFLHSGITGESRNRIIQHEYGHYLDYKFGLEGDRKKLLGSYLLGFYVKIGLPSLLNLAWGFKRLPAFSGKHSRYWTEIRANRLAKAYFGNALAQDFEAFFPVA